MAKKRFQFPEKFYDVDPVTGEMILVPLFTNKRSPTPVKITKPFEKLDFQAIKNEIAQESAKQEKIRRNKRQLAEPASRRLFPPKKLKTTANPFKRTMLTKKMPTTAAVTSPLMNLEEVEQQLLDKKSAIKTQLFKRPTNEPNIYSPKLDVIKENVKMETAIECEPISPENREFQEMEQICSNGTPMKSLCNLMHKAAINGSSEKLNCDNKLMKLHSEIEQKIKDEEIRHLRNVAELKAMLLTVSNIINDREKQQQQQQPPVSISRRSERLQQNQKLLTSPVILKCDDLRRSTLKNNLSIKNGEDSTQSPRTRNAMSLYGSLKDKNSFLETPKCDRKSNLSCKLKTQCLLLQDTPVNK